MRNVLGCACLLLAVAALITGCEDAFENAGSGEFVFNVDRRLIQSLSMSYRYTTDPMTTRLGKHVDGENVAITVDYRLLSPSEVPAQVAARDAARKKREETKAFFIEQDRHPRRPTLPGSLVGDVPHKQNGARAIHRRTVGRP